MSTEVLAPPGGEGRPATPQSAWLQWLRRGEDLLTVLTLAAMVLLPLVEACLRRFFQTGISGSSTLIQHLVFLGSMLGGALAAREGRLLSLSTLTHFLKGRWKSAAVIFGSAYGGAVSACLCLAATRFVLSKRDAADTLVYGLPLWIVLLALPLGYGVITWRMLWGASATWRGRATAFTLALLLLGVTWQSWISADRLVVPALLGLLVATFLGTPVFATLGGMAMILFWGRDQPIAMVSIDHYGLVINATLPTIPLFTLAGYFLAEGGASNRLVRVFQAWFGAVRGGPAIVTALVCAFFTSFTGASGVTILALGGLLMPVLLAAGYRERSALGLLTGAGALGLLFPPCLPLILYAVVATTVGTELTIGKMFLGGVVPGVIMVVLTAWWGVRQGPPVAPDARVFQPREAVRALWTAKWELLLPVVALVSMFGGFATPVEAAALTAFYAFFIETVLYRDLKLFKDVPRVVSECGLLVGGVLLILGVAMGFTDFLFDVSVPEKLVGWAKGAIHEPWVFLLALNVFLLIVGCLMDIFSAIVVVVPLIIPLGKEFGIDPVHLGIIFLANLELGYLTPPVGMNLFLASYRFNKPMTEVTKAVLPMLAVRLIGVLLITYVPFLTTLLPRWVK